MQMDHRLDYAFPGFRVLLRSKISCNGVVLEPPSSVSTTASPIFVERSETSKLVCLHCKLNYRKELIIVILQVLIGSEVCMHVCSTNNIPNELLYYFKKDVYKCRLPINVLHPSLSSSIRPPSNSFSHDGNDLFTSSMLGKHFCIMLGKHGY